MTEEDKEKPPKYTLPAHLTSELEQVEAMWVSAGRWIGSFYASCIATGMPKHAALQCALEATRDVILLLNGLGDKV